MGAGDSSYVTSPVGFVVSWLLVLFGVAIVATITGALVGFLIDFLLKEGQGMGASGYRDHIVVCGWNSTARELIAELDGDDYDRKIVLIHEADKNPGGPGVYFVNGDVTSSDDLRRAGIEEAMAAVVCPADPTNESDMRSILTVMAIESIAPQVRTVVEVNNPAHVEHFRRAKADEIMVTSRIASRLLARSSLYPGLAELVTDIVSGGEGSELYRVNLPDAYIGMSIDDLSAKLRSEHAATLLAIGRGGRAFVNPPSDWRRTTAPFSWASVLSRDWKSVICWRRPSSEAARMRTASRPALRAPPTATVATGTPAGICTMESSESRPSRCLSGTGTPITGSGVTAASIPGRWAAPPAPAMMTRSPRPAASAP